MLEKTITADTKETDKFLEYVQHHIKEIERYILETSDLTDTSDVSQHIILHRMLTEMVADYVADHMER